MSKKNNTKKVKSEAKQKQRHKDAQLERAIKHGMQIAAQRDAAIDLLNPLRMGLEFALHRIVDVVEMHAPTEVERTVAGEKVTRMECKQCKVLAPCKTFERANNTGNEVEALIKDVMGPGLLESEETKTVLGMGQPEDHLDLTTAIEPPADPEPQVPEEPEPNNG